MPAKSEFDPKGLIYDSYEIEGITIEECRSIFVDWAISLADGAVAKEHLAALVAQYGDRDHPMTSVLIEGLGDVAAKGRRGGRAGRMKG